MKRHREWGLYDVRDKCWLGTDGGPIKRTEQIARAMATVATEQLGRRILPARVPRSTPWRYKDVIPTKFGAEEAIKRIEGKCEC